MKVLITRPQAKAQPLLEQIEPLVEAVYHQNIIEITQGPDTEKLAKWLEQQPDKIIFVSGFAVEYFCNNIKQLNQEIELFAVGQSTATQLKQQLSQQFEQPIITPEVETSEGLLALEQLQSITDQHIVIVRGVDGRELLAEQLKARGANVDYWQVYQRQTLNDENWLKQWQQWQIDTIVVTSVAIYEGICQNTTLAWRQSCQWIVASSRIAQALEQDGISNIHNANGANDQAIIEQIQLIQNNQLRTKMSQQQNSQQQTPAVEAPTESATPTTSAATTNKPAKKASNTIAWLAFMLAIISVSSVGGAGYYWYQNQQNKLAEQQAWQTQQANQLAALEAALKQQIAANSGKLTQEQSQLTQSVNQAISQNLQVVENKINEMSGRQPHEWALAEANYLLNMAGRKLWLEDDINTALNLLANADITLANLNKPNLMPIRQALANDIAQIRGLANPRVEDIHIALSALINQIDQFEINNVEDEQIVISQQPKQVSENIDDWQQNLMNSVTTIFSKLFYIKGGVTEGDAQPMKMPRQQWFLRANIKMAWLQAQVALLKREQKVYADSINQSLNWLTHFNQADPKVQSAKITLETLITTRLTAQYPDQFTSQPLLEKAINNMTNEQGTSL